MFCKILYMPVLHLPFDYINIRFALYNLRGCGKVSPAEWGSVNG